MTVAQLEEASAVTPIVAVQNRYNINDRKSEDVLRHCERHGIAFLPWLPIAPLTRDGAQSAVGRVAERHGATAAQVALAWLLHRSPVVLPIPGTSNVEHLAQNVAAAGLKLDAEDLADLGA